MVSLEQMYSKKVLENFKNPKNMGTMKNPDAIGTIGNPICGDIMKVYLKVKDNKIKDIKVETFGCVAAVATSSIMTQMVKGKTLTEAEKLSRDAVEEAAGGLPPLKKHCSNLAADTLKAAIEDYYKKHPKGKKK
jgi:nitrogen fixation NifU-like protein